MQRRTEGLQNPRVGIFGVEIKQMVAMGFTNGTKDLLGFGRQGSEFGSRERPKKQKKSLRVYIDSAVGSMVACLRF